jgi:2-desacetyl-2-hydroxyethyl bacteriochlorophyllide A dehydrogenase
MRGAIYKGVGKVELGTFEIPKAGPNDVVVRNMRAGICGTDLHAYLIEGQSVGIRPEHQFGHEMAGYICEIGENVTGIEEGKKVFVNPVTCKKAKKGYTATEMADMAGAFSEYILVEDARIDYNLFPLPDELEYDRAVLIEPMSVSMHGVNTANPKPGEKAIVYGAGTIGLGALIELRAAGVKDVIISDISDKRLAIAEKLGGIPFNSHKGNLIAFVKEKWGAKRGIMGEETTDADIVIDCAGPKGILEEFMASAKVGSRFIILALGRGSEQIVPLEVVLKSVKIMGSCAYNSKDHKQVIELLNNQDILVEPMITHAFGLSDVAKAFEAAADKDNAIKVVINHEK